MLKDPNLLYHLLVDVLHALLQPESLETEQAEAQADLLEGSTSEKDRRPDGNKSQQRLKVDLVVVPPPVVQEVELDDEEEGEDGLQHLGDDACVVEVLELEPPALGLDDLGGSVEALDDNVGGEAAEDLDELPRMDRDIQLASASPPEIDRVTPDPEVKLDEILMCLSRVLNRAEMFEHHHIQFETLSTREKMSEILERISEHKFIPLVALLIKNEGRLGVVVTFLAVMELLKDSLVEIVQSDPFGPIHIKSRT